MTSCYSSRIKTYFLFTFARYRKKHPEISGQLYDVKGERSNLYITQFRLVQNVSFSDLPGNLVLSLDWHLQCLLRYFPRKNPWESKFNKCAAESTGGECRGFGNKRMRQVLGEMPRRRILQDWTFLHKWQKKCWREIEVVGGDRLCSQFLRRLNTGEMKK